MKHRIKFNSWLGVSFLDRPDMEGDYFDDLIVTQFDPREVVALAGFPGYTRATVSEKNPENHDFTLVRRNGSYYMTGCGARLEICESKLRRLFGKIPQRIYVRVNRQSRPQ